MLERFGVKQDIRS